MTRNPNAYPEPVTSMAPPERGTYLSLGTRLYRKAAVAAGSLLLLTGCTSGSETKAEPSTTPKAETTAVYPDNPQLPSMPFEAEEIPESERAVLQVECLKNTSVDSHIDPATTDKIEFDLLKSARGKLGIVSKILFDVDKDGISMQIQPTGHDTITRNWEKAELYNGLGYTIDYYGKTVLRYPAWRDGMTGVDYVTFTIGCNELEPKQETPLFEGALPIPATIALPPSKA